MTGRSDLDRRLEAFLRDDPTELPEPSFDAIRDGIEHTRQRAVLGPWRVPDIMNRLTLVAGSAIALVLVVVVGSQLLAPGGTGGAGAGATPSPTTPPTATPSPTGEAFLPEGAYRVVDSEPQAVPITVTIPADGWRGHPEFGGMSKGDLPSDDAPEAALLAWSWAPGSGVFVYGDPCAWKTTTPAAAATTVDAIVAALAAQASRDASTPVDVTVDGHAGKSLVLHVPEDAVFSDCDQGTFGSYGSGDLSEGPFRTHQGPGQIDELWILDVDGSVVILTAMYRPDSPAELVEELRGVAESATFE